MPPVAPERRQIPLRRSRVDLLTQHTHPRNATSRSLPGQIRTVSITLWVLGTRLCVREARGFRVLGMERATAAQIGRISSLVRAVQRSDCAFGRSRLTGR